MVIGITGKIGSGKSLALAYMKTAYDAACIIEDETAHEIMQNDEDVIRGIVSFFGEDILDKAGKVDRLILRERIRENPEDIDILNSLIHPRVLKTVTGQIKELSETGRDLILVESALPKEARFSEFCDEIWVIDSDQEIRRKRLSDSRGMSGDSAESMEKRQLIDLEDAGCPVRIIMNNDGIDALYRELDSAYSAAFGKAEDTEDRE